MMMAAEDTLRPGMFRPTRALGFDDLHELTQCSRRTFQWVFIKPLNIHDGALIVTSEHDKIYRVDLKTKTVTEAARVQEKEINP
jgi:hypothetical protein